MKNNNMAKVAPSIRLDTLPEQVFTRIKKMILSGELKGGDKIPEIRIAEELGVSRTPIREALRKLDEYGLISIKPRRFAEVLNMTHDEVVELTLIRVHLEKLAVALFIERSTPDDIIALKALVTESKQLFDSKDIGGFYEKDSQFHIEIAHRSRNPFISMVMEKLDAKVQLSRLVKPLNESDILGALREHEQLVDYLNEKNAVLAIDFIEKHINNNL